MKNISNNSSKFQSKNDFAESGQLIVSEDVRQRFTAVDLWNIHRSIKVKTSRRYL